MIDDVPDSPGAREALEYEARNWARVIVALIGLSATIAACCVLAPGCVQSSGPVDASTFRTVDLGEWDAGAGGGHR